MKPIIVTVTFKVSFTSLHFPWYRYLSCLQKFAQKTKVVNRNLSTDCFQERERQGGENGIPNIFHQFHYKFPTFHVSVSVSIPFKKKDKKLRRKRRRKLEGEQKVSGRGGAGEGQGTLLTPPLCTAVGCCCWFWPRSINKELQKPKKTFFRAEIFNPF